MCYQNCQHENYDGECTKSGPFLPCSFRNCIGCDTEFDENELNDKDQCKDCEAELME
jgi:hypothetical protein